MHKLCKLSLHSNDQSKSATRPESESRLFKQKMGQMRAYTTFSKSMKGKKVDVFSRKTLKMQQRLNLKALVGFALLLFMFYGTFVSETGRVMSPQMLFHPHSS